MRTLPWLALGAALVAGALAWHLLGERAEPEELEALASIDRASLGGRPDLLSGAPPQLATGGTFGGIVLEAGTLRPIQGAQVLLVRFETGQGMTIPQWRPDGSDFDPSLLPRIGAHEVAGQTRTDKDGRFRLTAGARDVPRLVVAWDPYHAPRYAFTGPPEAELRILLDKGGTLTGKVVAPDGQPVRGAIVDVYLQTIARPTPIPSHDNPYPRVQGPAPPVPAVATLGDLIGREIGPRIYGLDPGRQDSLRFLTGVDGTFRVGPLDDSAQLWVVITHPDYMWTDFDEIEGVGIRRPVLHPGETLERTYTLQTGNWIEGRVVSAEDESQGVEGVAISLRHPVHYKRHPFYATHARRTVTRADGSFRMSGLTHGPYVADLKHPSFGADTWGVIPANTKGLKWMVKSRGGLEGTVEGLSARPPGGRIEVMLEPVGEGGATTTTVRMSAVVDDRGVFTLERLVPGDYRVSVRAGTLACQPVQVRVVSLQVTRTSFSAFGGAELRATVVDGAGRAVDPASVTLVRLAAGDGAGTSLGSFVTRAGRLDETGVAPGRYRLEVTAPGFLAGATEAFELIEGRGQTLPPVVLRRPATLRIGSVGAERGRAPSDVRLELKQGEGPWQPLLVRDGQVLVQPGPLSLRATDDLGRTFAHSLELAEGASATVDVRLREP